MWGGAAAGIRVTRKAFSGTRGRDWLAAVALSVMATAAVVSAHYATPASSLPAAHAPLNFQTLPPGARLPSGAQCARWVRASPSPETRSANTTFNHTVGHKLGPGFFPAGDSPQAAKLAQRINGDFTGTTRQILQWAACKWGIDQDVVFAQAAVESWWRQGELGDWATNADRCPLGHGIGANGIRGQCPQSYGVMQNKYVLEKGAWPSIATSTAMNADVAYAFWRACYDGYESWLNNEPKGRPYRAGDLWGCVGRWFSGSWYTYSAYQYISLVGEFLREAVWASPGFAETG